MTLSTRHRKIAGLITIAFIVAFTLWRGSKARCWQLAGEVTCRVETSERIVALSFDDGPSKEGVDTVLAELDKRKLKATFFLIGNRMEWSPGQAERLVQAGHELGNHSYTHKWMMGHSQDWYDQEIAKTDALLRKAGAETKLFRPPFGRRLFGLPWAVEKAGYQMITWDVADDIEHHPTPQDYASDIIARAQPGSIILIHPMNSGNKVERAAIPAILDGLAAKGLRVVTVGELLNRKGR